MTDLPRRAFSIALRELSPFSFIQSASAVSALSGLIRNSKILTHTMGAASARPPTREAGRATSGRPRMPHRMWGVVDGADYQSPGRGDEQPEQEEARHLSGLLRRPFRGARPS